MACTLLVTGYLTDWNYSENNRVCRGSVASRFLLIPFIVLSTILVVMYTFRLHALRSGACASPSIDMYVEQESDKVNRVAKLPENDDCEVAEVNKTPAYDPQEVHGTPMSSMSTSSVEEEGKEKPSKGDDYQFTNIPHAVSINATKSSSSKNSKG